MHPKRYKRPSSPKPCGPGNGRPVCRIQRFRCNRSAIRRHQSSFCPTVDERRRKRSGWCTNWPFSRSESHPSKPRVVGPERRTGWRRSKPTGRKMTSKTRCWPFYLDDFFLCLINKYSLYETRSIRLRSLCHSLLFAIQLHLFTFCFDGSPPFHPTRRSFSWWLSCTVAQVETSQTHSHTLSLPSEYVFLWLSISVVTLEQASIIRFMAVLKALHQRS